MSESTDPANDGVDEFVVDPIRISLLATIDDENTAYRDVEKTERASLFEAKTVDIWEHANRPAQCVDRSYPLSRKLPPDLFEAYHPEIPQRRGGGTRLALRLLCTRPVLGGNQTARHDDLGPMGDKQINYLPFLPGEMQDLIHQWDLNREYSWMRLNAREVGNFQRKTVWNFKVNPPRAVRMGSCQKHGLIIRGGALTRVSRDRNQLPVRAASGPSNQISRRQQERTRLFAPLPQVAI